jgi:hypothetical protein
LYFFSSHFPLVLFLLFIFSPVNKSAEIPSLGGRGGGVFKNNPENSFLKYPCCKIITY